MDKHYSGRKPNITKAYGWIVDEELQAVVTYGKPANYALCDGVCGKAYSGSVYELNRLCRNEEFHEPMSQFVASTLRRLSTNNWIIVSYADEGAGHQGYIYQALNFMYTGGSKERLQFHVPGGHSRHGTVTSPLREVRTVKHRYIYFATKDRRLKREWTESLNYPVMPYPKRSNTNYELGSILRPTVVDISGVERIVVQNSFFDSEEGNK